MTEWGKKTFSGQKNIFSCVKPNDLFYFAGMFLNFLICENM